MCDDQCVHSVDGDCDDGGPGAEWNSCVVGTDCHDCGSRHMLSTAPPLPSPPPPGAMPPSPSPPPPGASCCSDSCYHASDGDCDDGGSGAETSLCLLGQDCADCGVRASCSIVSSESSSGGAGVFVGFLFLSFPCAIMACIIVCARRKRRHNQMQVVAPLQRVAQSTVVVQGHAVPVVQGHATVVPMPQTAIPIATAIPMPAQSQAPMIGEIAPVQQMVTTTTTTTTTQMQTHHPSLGSQPAVQVQPAQGYQGCPPASHPQQSVPMAVGLDTTGDGLADSVGVDTTGDGRVDTVLPRRASG